MRRVDKFVVHAPGRDVSFARAGAVGTVLTECTLGPYTRLCCLDRSASRPREICSGMASRSMALADPGPRRQHGNHWTGCRHCTHLERPRRIDSTLGHCLVEAPRRKHGIHPDLPSLAPGNLGISVSCARHYSTIKLRTENAATRWLKSGGLMLRRLHTS